MYRIIPNSLAPIGAVSYRDRLRTGDIGRKEAPILQGHILGLPPKVAGIVCLADLQGSGGTVADPRLPVLDSLDELERLAQAGVIPPLRQMIVVSAGDLFALAHKRGGSGDVRHCWLAMRDRFTAAVGVAGNHDRFGEGSSEYNQFRKTPGVHLMNVDIANVAGVRFGGVSGIIGDPNRRPFRHTEEDFHAGIEMVLYGAPDILVLHQGPMPGTDHKFASPGIRERCARLHRGIVVYGHDHTEQAFEEMPTGAHFLSVHERVVVLTRPPS